jgi:hypothetical protein
MQCGCRCPLAFVAALLAVLGQFVCATAVPQPFLELLSFSPICHSDGTAKTSAPGHKDVPTRHAATICMALAMPTPLPSASPFLPGPPAAILLLVGRDGVAAPPPALFPLAAEPRGPPIPA